MTPAEYSQWVDAFCLKPGNVAHAARVMKQGKDRARRLWFRGEPKDGFGPVREMVTEQMVLARAARQRDAIREAESEAKELTTTSVVETAVFDALVRSQEARDAAARDSAQTRKEEGQLVSGTRGNALLLAASTAQLLSGALELSTHVERALKAARLEGSNALSLKEAVALLRQAAAVVRFQAEAGKFVVQTERMVMGKLIEEGTPEEKMGLDEAESWVHQASDAIKRRRAREEASRREDATKDEPAER